MVIPDRTARLCDILHAALVRTLDVIAEREEGITAQAHTGHGIQPGALFLGGQRGRLLGEGLGPYIVADDIQLSAFWPARRVQCTRLCWPAPTPMVWPSCT